MEHFVLFIWSSEQTRCPKRPENVLIRVQRRRRQQWDGGEESGSELNGNIGRMDWWWWCIVIVFRLPGHLHHSRRRRRRKGCWIHLILWCWWWWQGGGGKVLFFSSFLDLRRRRCGRSCLSHTHTISGQRGWWRMDGLMARMEAKSLFFHSHSSSSTTLVLGRACVHASLNSIVNTPEKENLLPKFASRPFVRLASSFIIIDRERGDHSKLPASLLCSLWVWIT